MNASKEKSALLGTSPAVERVRLQIKRFAPHFRTMLLIGEPGTGKQAIGRELHRLSPVAAEPFAVVDLPDFIIGAGADRFVYLRGLGQVRADMQDQLLNRLAGLSRETRLIVACESEPRALQAAGHLRTEVLERVGMLEIRVPALRERLDDLDMLAACMLDTLGCPARWIPTEREAARRHPWPGNLAELWSTCERFAAHRTLALAHALEPTTQLPERLEEVRLEQVVSRHVMDILERCAGNKLRAAELLGISRSTLYRMLEAAG